MSKAKPKKAKKSSASQKPDGVEGARRKTRAHGDKAIAADAPAAAAPNAASAAGEKPRRKRRDTSASDSASGSSSSKKYSARDIKVLGGLEAVRKRPAMYIGGTDGRGLHHLVWEIVDNSVDEVINGHASTISVTLHSDLQTCTVKDNGRGIPTDIHPEVGVSALEVILTTLHSGAKFGHDSYRFSGGLHGVGSSVVNALSEELEAIVTRDGKRWRQRFRRGKPTAPIAELEGAFRGSGTEITFKADAEIFGAARFDAAIIAERLEIKTYLHRGLKVNFRDEKKGESHNFEHGGGLAELIASRLAERKGASVHPDVFSAEKTEEGEDGFQCEVALAWTTDTATSIETFANGIPTGSGGSHDLGLKGGIVKALRNYMSGHEIAPKGVNISADDMREGICGALSIYLREPQFEGQTKDRLNSPRAQAFVEGLVRLTLEKWLNENPSSAESILGRIVLAARAREASRDAVSAVTRKSATQSRLNLPGKLADCQISDSDSTELFIVEGDSAGGSAKQGRERKFQAILPLRGKVLNTEQAKLKVVIENKELADVVKALGCGIGASFDIRKLRYGKIVLLMDADADGHHIATLLMTFFYRHMPELIKQRRIFLAQPPLYRVATKKETLYAQDEAERDRLVKKLGKGGKVEIMRFKGLGEMNPATLFETTLDPARRVLLEVRVTSEIETNNTIVELMGKDTASRYRFIMESAEQADAEALDV